MNKLLSLLLLASIIFSNRLCSQNFWELVLAEEQHEKSIFKGVYFLGDSIIITNSLTRYTPNQNYCYRPYVATFIDVNGKILKEFFNENQVIWSNSEYALLVGSNSISDLYDPRLFLTKIDKYGNEVFSTVIGPNVDIVANPNNHWMPECELAFSPGILGLDVNSKEEILIFLNEGLFKFDKEGNWMGCQYHSISGGTNFYLENDSTLIENFNHGIYRKDTVGELVNASMFNEDCLYSVQLNNLFYQLFSDKVLILNSLFEVIDTLVRNDALELKEIKVFGDKIYVSGIQEDEIAISEITHNGFEDVNTFENLTEETSFIVANNNYLFSGNSASGQTAIYNYKNEQTNKLDEYPDIQINNVRIDSIIEYYIPYPNGPFLDSRKFHLSIEVENIGSNDINSFGVGTNYQVDGLWCEIYLESFYQKFDNIIMLEGAKQRFILDPIQINYNRSINTNCFEVMAPNNKLEWNIDNNVECDIILSNKQEAFIESQASIYPNPTTDIVKVQNEFAYIESYRLTDVSGRILDFRNNIDKKDFEIEVTKLSNGLYFLSLSIEGEFSSFPIIKQ